MSDTSDFMVNTISGYAAISDLKLFYREFTSDEVQRLHSAETGGFDCIDPGVPSNGMQVGIPSLRNGTSVMFTCDTGYTLEGTDVITCIEGVWLDNIPVCTGIIVNDKQKPGRT
ncbi:C4b-binding protein beta chain-like [Saccoglossus kowalevskii]